MCSNLAESNLEILGSSAIERERIAELLRKCFTCWISIVNLLLLLEASPSPDPISKQVRLERESEFWVLQVLSLSSYFQVSCCQNRQEVLLFNKLILDVTNLLSEHQKIRSCSAFDSVWDRTGNRAREPLSSWGTMETGTFVISLKEETTYCIRNTVLEWTVEHLETSRKRQQQWEWEECPCQGQWEGERQGYQPGSYIGLNLSFASD